MTAFPRFLAAGDTAFTVEFGDAITPALLAAVHALDLAVQRRQQGGGLPGLRECVPSFRSLTLIYDPCRTSAQAMQQEVCTLLGDLQPQAVPSGRQWRLPVCYAGELAADLADCAAHAGMSCEELVRLHAAQEFYVYMQGFLPGFPFMGDVPVPLQRPRRETPRVRVPAGSVAVANTLTAIYPWESPGGWHILGNCPIPLFDPRWAEPALLAAGDRVRFVAVSAAEHALLKADYAAGRREPQACRTGGTGD